MYVPMSSPQITSMFGRFSSGMVLCRGEKERERVSDESARVRASLATAIAAASRLAARRITPGATHWAAVSGPLTAHLIRCTCGVEVEVGKGGCVRKRMNE